MDEETVARAAYVIGDAIPGWTNGDCTRSARALAEAGLLLGAKERECVEAAEGYAEAWDSNSQRHDAGKRVADAGRAVQEVWGIGESGGGWVALYEPWRGSVAGMLEGKRELDKRPVCGPFPTEADARKACAALNAAWGKK